MMTFQSCCCSELALTLTVARAVGKKGDLVHPSLFKASATGLTVLRLAVRNGTAAQTRHSLRLCQVRVNSYLFGLSGLWVSREMGKHPPVGRDFTCSLWPAEGERRDPVVTNPGCETAEF